MKPINYGGMNAHVIGMTLKEIMRRANVEVWRRRMSFVGKEKISDYKADKNDRVTDVDFASQAIFLKKFKECFPGFGIVAEEEGFRQECALEDCRYFFTVDPLDGTKAFERRQSSGFGPMISLCSE